MSTGGFRIGTAFVEVETRDHTEGGLSRVGFSLVRWARRLGERVSEILSRGFSRAVDWATDILGTFFKNMTNAGGEMASNIAASVVAALTSGTAFTAATGGLNLLIGALLGAAAAAGLVATGFVALAPILLLAGGAAGSLFTVIAGGIATFAVFKLGLSGVGDAFGEVMENGKATEETLKKLSPAARSLVKELEKIKPQLDKIRSFVQDKLLDGMNVQLRNLAGKWGPAAKEILGGLATTLNGIGKKVFEAFGQTTFIDNMKTAAAGFGGMLDKIGGAIPGLIDSFGRLAAKSVPFLSKIGELVAGVFEKFSAWIKSADESGALESFMTKAAKTLQDIWDIGGLAFGIVKDIIKILFPGSAQASEGVLGGVKEALQKVKDWLGDPENQKKIKEFVDNVGTMIKTLATEVVPKIVEIINKVSEWVTKVEGWITKIKQFKTDVLQTWEDIKKWTVEKWDAIVEFFKGLPDRVGTALAELPGKVRAKVTEMAMGALEQIGFFIGAAIGTLITLPLKAAVALAELPGQIREKFIQAKNWATTTASELVSGAITWLSGLPSKAASAVAALPGVLSGAFNSAKSAAISAVSGMVSSVGSLISSIPGRAMDALGGLGSLLYNAGRSLLQGLLNGINSKIGDIKAALKGVTNLIPSWKGPMDVDKRLLEPSGAALMGGLMKGISGQIPALREQLGSITASIPRMTAARTSAHQAAGPAYHFAPGSIVLDASRIKSVQDLIELMTSIKTTSRAFTARTATAGAR